MKLTEAGGEKKITQHFDKFRKSELAWVSLFSWGMHWEEVLVGLGRVLSVEGDVTSLVTLHVTMSPSLSLWLCTVYSYVLFRRYF